MQERGGFTRRGWTQTRARALGVTMRNRSKNMAPAEKALYHAELGAGKSRVIRDFFGLTGSDLDALTAMVRASVRTAR